MHVYDPNTCDYAIIIDGTEVARAATLREAHRIDYNLRVHEIVAAVREEIATTNNGKLLKGNMGPLRPYLEFLLDDGYVKPATFLNFGDSIQRA